MQVVIVAYLNDRAFIPKHIDQIGHRLAQFIVATPALNAMMHRFAARITLQQHVPMGIGVQNPESGFEYLAGRNRVRSGRL